MSIGDLITLIEAHPVVTGVVVALVSWFTGIFKWILNSVFGTKDKAVQSTALTQTHSGAGNNVGRDKVVNTHNSRDRRIRSRMRRSPRRYMLMMT